MKTIVLGCVMALATVSAQADWLEDAKQGAKSLWDGASEKAQEVSESETVQQLKEDSGEFYQGLKEESSEVMDKVQSNETVQSVWEKTKTLSTEAYDKAKEIVQEETKE